MADTLPRSIRVATYNVHACVGTDGRHDPDRVAAVIAELDADVVALQEFTYPASVAIDTRAPVVLTTLDRYECALGPTRKNSTHCFGNALLTRHPHRRDPSDRPVDGAPGTARGASRPRLTSAARRCTSSRRTLAFASTNAGSRSGRSSTTWTRCRSTRFVVLGDFNDWLPGRTVVHVLDHRLGRAPRPRSFPAFWPVVAARPYLGAPEGGR